MKSDGNYLVVTWDLSTTGRRLTDEICHIGAYYKVGEEEKSFSQYVMPHKSPDSVAVKRYHLQVSNYGRYRVLMNTETRTYLKTKSEYTALGGFMDWLESSSKGKDGVILVFHESARYILVPLLLDALKKYKFIPRFKETVKGFSNGISFVDTHGNKEKITSNSLRSLSKTVLNNTDPQTTSTLDRCSIFYQIISQIAQDKESSLEKAVYSVVSSVEEEEEKVISLKAMLSSQNTLRPIFQSLLMQKRFLREQAVALRKIVVDAGLDYSALEELYKAQEKDVEKATVELRKRLGDKSDEESLNKLIDILNRHFIPSSQPKANTTSTKTSPKVNTGGEEIAVATPEETPATSNTPPPPTTPAPPTTTITTNNNNNTEASSKTEA